MHDMDCKRDVAKCEKSSINDFCSWGFEYAEAKLHPVSVFMTGIFLMLTCLFHFDSLSFYSFPCLTLSVNHRICYVCSGRHISSCVAANYLQAMPDL